MKKNCFLPNLSFECFLSPFLFLRSGFVPSRNEAEEAEPPPLNCLSSSPDDWSGPSLGDQVAVAIEKKPYLFIQIKKETEKERFCGNKTHL